MPEGQDYPSLVNGITIENVAGAPFSATVVIEFERENAEGYIESFRTINLVARDAAGRTHNETRRFMPENFHGSPNLLGVRIFDPRTRKRISYDPRTRVAHEQIIPKQPEVAIPPDPSAQVEDLGTSTLNGLTAKGTRRIVKIPKKRSGIGEAVKVEHEEWYSEDLHINVLIRHSDPRVGTETIGISNLKREPPPASMFDVPPGYQILTVRPGDAAEPEQETPPPAETEAEPQMP